MSPKTTKSTAAKHPAKHNVPIVNVFDEDQSAPSLQPARRPVVVEIENVPTTSDLQTPSAPQFTQPAPQQMPEQLPPMPQPQTQPQEVPVQQPIQHYTQPEISNVAPVQPFTPPAPQAPEVTMVSPQGMSAEPMLPSFFEHDLKNGTPAQAPVAPGAPVQPVGTPFQQTSPFPPVDGALPQAMVGEINEAAKGGGSNKKIIGIILMVLAVLILAIGGLFLYARNMFAPIPVETPSPTPMGTPRPTIAPTTPTPVASSSATASESAAMKKKVKVDVLNGTKIAGLATSNAAILKTAGFVTGTVGNGKPENAGTIVYPKTYLPLVTEIQTLLKDFTFTASESASATTIQVTLGE